MKKKAVKKKEPPKHEDVSPAAALKEAQRLIKAAKAGDQFVLAIANKTGDGFRIVNSASDQFLMEVHRGILANVSPIAIMMSLGKRMGEIKKESQEPKKG